MRNSNIRASSWAIGETVLGMMEFRRTGMPAAPAHGTLGMSFQVVANGAGIARTCFPWAVTNDNQANFDQSGLLRTPKFVLPGGTTLPVMEFSVSGGGILDVDRAGMFNLTRNADYS
jgi:hypothetical protein